MNIILAMGYSVQLNIDDWAAGLAQLKGKDIKGRASYLIYFILLDTLRVRKLGLAKMFIGLHV